MVLSFASAQAQTAPKKQPAPRTKDGKPDLSGIYWAPGSRTESPTGSADSIFAANIARNLKPGDLVMQPWGEKLYKERQANKGKDDPEKFCLPSGVPRTNSLPYKIVQTPTVVLIMYEGNIHTYRQVFLDKKEHSDDLDPTWYGESIGHWDGDTLVVDTVGFNDRTWLDAAGHPHSEQLHVTERYARPEQGRLEIEVTVDDPKAYTKPFTVKEASALAENRELREYVCSDSRPKQKKK